MKTRIHSRRFVRRCSQPWRAVARLCLEVLEHRALPSLTPWPGLSNPQVETEPNNTVDQALDLGTISLSGRAEAVGTIGGEGGAADVDWFRFSLDRTAHVVLDTLNELAGTSLVSVLSLYNEDTDGLDLYNPLGKRLLAQTDGAASGQRDAHLSHDLPAGTYYAAVSGSGNRFFHPSLGDSGLPGSTGDYGLQITVTDLGLVPANGPALVAADPDAGANLTAAPLMLRVTLSNEIDPSSILPGQNIQLLFNQNGSFGVGNDIPVALNLVEFGVSVKELRIQPAAPLTPGFYRLILSGDSSLGNPVLTDVNGSFLGQNADNLLGRDYTLDFQISGREGVPVADPAADPIANDTADTARDLGDLSAGIEQQIVAATGDDPAYDVSSADPRLANPANDVDLYRFHLTGSGRHAFIAEVFAGRIGSPLDAGLSLFRLNTGTNQWELLANNEDTLNPGKATDFTMPLFVDPALVTGLVAGEYLVAVSGLGNVPNATDLLPGTNGIFDPTVSHSGEGSVTLAGPYVLSLRVQLDEAPPEVSAVTPGDGDLLTGPPTHLFVQFNEPMNVQALAYQAFLQTSQVRVSSVFVQTADGAQLFPRLESFDPATNQAQFLMLDGLANGIHELHLSGPLGLTDLAGNPLPGNDPSGDYVVRFTVEGPERGSPGNPLLWQSREPNDSFDAPQDLGLLFPQELATGVRIGRDYSQDPASAPADTADHYRIEVLQSQVYIFNFTATGLPVGFRVKLRDATGNLIALARQGAGAGGMAMLDPGVYTIDLSGWNAVSAAQVVYEMRINLGSLGDNPMPLTTGPTPLARIRLATTRPPEPLPPPPAQPLLTNNPEVTDPASASNPQAAAPPLPAAPLVPPGTAVGAPQLATDLLPPLPASDLPPPVRPLDGTANPPTQLVTTEVPPASTPVTPVTPPALNQPPLSIPVMPITPTPAPVQPRTGNSHHSTDPVPQPAGPALVTIVTVVAPTLPNLASAVRETGSTSSTRLPLAAAVPSLLSTLAVGPVGGVRETSAQDSQSPPTVGVASGLNTFVTQPLRQPSNSATNTEHGGQALHSAETLPATYQGPFLDPRSLPRSTEDQPANSGRARDNSLPVEDLWNRVLDLFFQKQTPEQEAPPRSAEGSSNLDPQPVREVAQVAPVSDNMEASLAGHETADSPWSQTLAVVCGALVLVQREKPEKKRALPGFLEREPQEH